jgi:chemotaxis response regulator CheB
LDVNAQRVLVVENESLLGAGIERLLTHEDCLNVCGISPRSVSQLLYEIERFRPDVIVLDAATELATSAELLTCLWDYPEMRVVAVRRDGALMSIYEKQEVAITQTADFVAVIRQDCQELPDKAEASPGDTPSAAVRNP